ncbi:AAA family ATPase [Canibacter sp. lx-72]|uniref:AAA family ATPase n=1 Tax=Canibacter zhuwentaonis TaxID=2837491 RepID=UPI001BDBD713|nr:AAA family ATPase [Canibacter zhuwentaonis]MBT1017572.1 AAA family ATPase [Canibacter zhuwentaonis]
MSFLLELAERGSYSPPNAEFYFTYNHNSGGGQAFLGGRPHGRDGHPTDLKALDGMLAEFAFRSQEGDENEQLVRLGCDDTRYRIKPRGSNSTQMKLEVQDKRNPSVALAAFLLLPTPCGARKSKYPETHTPISEDNFWVQRVEIRATYPDATSDSVLFDVRDILLSSGVQVKGSIDTIRNFRLDYEARISFVLNYADREDADPTISRLLAPFASWYRGEREFDFDDAVSSRDHLVSYLVTKYSTQFTGIEDPLAGVMRTVHDSHETELCAQPLVHHPDRTFDYPMNLVSFGAPGTGKSFGLETRLKSFLNDGGTAERVTFYADYTYGQFVGTYKPVVQQGDHGRDTVTYGFVPGPFLRVLMRALQSQRSGDGKHHLLVIEELNRAMPSSVFGDMFQLLDRDISGKSQYSVSTSHDLRRFLAHELQCSELEASSISLPGNMHIWATMNSADQGVFPIDTAFKRRWDFEYVGIDTNEELIAYVEVNMGADEYAQTVNWNALRKAINNFLSHQGVNEDRLMGPFFLPISVMPGSGDDPTAEERFLDQFEQKVLMYLFEDAGRQCRSMLFPHGDSALRYSSLCTAFRKQGISIFHHDIVAEVGIDGTNVVS